MSEKQHKSRISLIIPAFNEASHIGPCLDSIAAQTVQPFEVIVVDNNSTDETLGILKKYLFVRVVKEKNQGVVFARNLGFNSAKGDIIGRIDADVILPANWIEYLQNFYKDPNHSNIAWTGSGKFYNVRLPKLVHYGYRLLAFRLNSLLAGHVTLWGSNMALPKEIWENVQSKVCLRTDIHEDLDLAIHTHEAGYQIYYDTKLETNACLRRAQTNRHELWAYLQWWPRTLKIHKRWTWPIVWLFGAFLLYPISLLLPLAEWLARLLGRPAISTD